MNRRGFFSLLAATCAAPVAFAADRQPVSEWCGGMYLLPLPIRAAVRYRLYGDGIRNDTEAFKAYVSGKPVELPDGSIGQVTNGVVDFPPGVYNLNFSRIQWPQEVAIEVPAPS